MIIQRALKGISRIGPADAEGILSGGIICNWWRKVNLLPNEEIPSRLTDRNLDWHQNRYADPDPLEGGEPFYQHTPFLSLTAGTVERDVVRNRNIVHFAWEIALHFATDQWRADGCIFHCYVFILGRKSVAHRAFSEELRELNVYSSFSPFQPEGEITSKILVPPTQIERCDFYSITQVTADILNGVLPTPTTTISNPLYQRPDDISNLRELLR
jgi:hypothetical protein